MPAPRRLGRVLVTGACGFLGAAVVRRLEAEGTPVVAADIASEASSATATAIRSGDVTKPAELEAIFRSDPIDTVLHCGAVSGPMVLADQPALIWRINAQGTADLLNIALRHGVGRVVVCSTTEVYGVGRAGLLDETVLPDPPTIYGASKVAAEQAVLGYSAEHGLDAAAIRLSWIYGPGRRTPTMLEDLLRKGLRGETVRLQSHPCDRTHYLFLDDAVSGLLAAASAERVTSRIYNVTAGEGSTMGGVADAVQGILPGLRVEFTNERPAGRGPDGFDGRRAAAELGYRPSIAFADGLSRTLDAFRGE